METLSVVLGIMALLAICALGFSAVGNRSKRPVPAQPAGDFITISVQEMVEDLRATVKVAPPMEVQIAIDASTPASRCGAGWLP